MGALENILHTTERPTRGTFHATRGHDYRTHDVEMHISEIGLCGGHSASGVWVDENAATTVPGLYAAGDLACVPHNYMIGAFVFGDLAGAHAAGTLRPRVALPEDQIEAAHSLVYQPLSTPDGPPQQQVEYKLRRFVNDYVAPPKTTAKLEIALETFDRMSGEIASMGARTPHELMRCAEVTFIRDCAEMAARSSLMRTESRWGLYHDRTDHPGRDDVSWLAHLNLRKNAAGEMEFLKRPVTPYVVPVPEFTPSEIEVTSLGTHTAFTGHTPPTVFEAAPTRTHSSPRVLEVLSLAEEQPSLEELAGYLADADAEVRTTAIAVLTEAAPAGFGTALATALHDIDARVRAAAAAGLRELVEVLPPSAELGSGLRSALSVADADVRAVALDVSRALRLGDVDLFASSLSDPAVAVRIEAVRGLVSLDAAAVLASAATDAAREVRVAVAAGLGTIGDPRATDTVAGLAEDRDPLVRAAALTAAADLGTGGELARLAVIAVADPAWQVRRGAATALGALDAPSPSLLEALTDEHPNVRRAAVQALGKWVTDPEVAARLRTRRTDSDADVRAFIRMALGG